MKPAYVVILVNSTGHAVRIEKLFGQEKIACKLIPVPRQLSSDCGVCVRIHLENLERVKEILVEQQIIPQGIEAL